jgi:predicted metal-dependent peptidase
MSRLTEARNALILGQPFFGVLSLRLALQEDPGIETMGVDGVTLSYNPEWVDALPFDELVGVTAHEVMHCAAGHHARRGSRDDKRWNHACDYAINPLLIEAGFKLPDKALVRDEFQGLSAEEIYTRLISESGGGGATPEEKPDNAPQNSSVPDVGGCGSFSDGPGDSVPATAAELSGQAREWEIATMQAAAAAKGAGQLPAAGAYLVDEITAPKVSWRDMLREFITERARTEYSWLPPNRRYIHQGLYLPSRDSKELGEIVVAIDTSGSISDVLLDAFAAEINGIIEDARPSKIHVVYCTTQVTKAESFEPDEAPIAIEANDRGGTAFAPVWDWVAEQGIDPACAVYLTDLDGYGNAFGQDPGFPVLWASTLKTEAPYGEVIKLTL